MSAAKFTGLCTKLDQYRKGKSRQMNLNLFISPISAKNGCSSNHAYSGNGMKITIKLLVLKNLAVKSSNLLIKKIHSVNELF